MKIGIITDFVDGKLGGIGTYTYNLIKNLNRIDKENQYTLIHYMRDESEIYTHNNNIIIPRSPHYRGSGIIWRYVNLPRHLKTCRDLDIVHDPYEIGPLSYKMPFSKITTICDLTPVLFPHTFNLATVMLHKVFLKRTLNDVSKIVTISHSTKRDLIHYFKIPDEKITVTHLAANENFRPMPESEVDAFRDKYNICYPYILYVGTLEPRKNIPNLITAFSSLKKAGYPHKLIITGKPGWKYEKIFETVRSLKLESEVIFMGRLSDKELPYIYNGAELFVYPSLYEGFGLPPLEAMACGTPVITSNSSSLPEVVGDAGITVDPYNVNMLASAMRDVITNSELRENMIEQGKDRAKRFNWESTARRTLSVYEETLP